MAELPPAEGRIRSERIETLDGLRGIAAVVVMLYHACLTVPVLDQVLNHPGEGAMESAPAWAKVVAYSAIHLMIAGNEAVYLFFVLSGFVLARPLMASGAPAAGWRSYYG